jgi:hypothetical protein
MLASGCLCYYFFRYSGGEAIKLVEYLAACGEDSQF